MNKNLKKARAIAYLRQLCCSGLNKELVIPEFLVAIKSVLPSGSNCLCDVSKHFKPSDYFLEPGDDGLNNLLQIIVDYWTPNRTLCFAGLLASYPVITEPKLFDKSYYLSDLYNITLLPFDRHYPLCAPVLFMGKPIGVLTLYRPKNHKPFDQHEQSIFVRLMPYLTYAMMTSADNDIEYCEKGTIGMLIMNAQGKVLYQSEIAEKLLDLACNPVVNMDAAKQKSLLIAKLVQLCLNLGSIFRGEAADPPIWCYVNGRGRFIFRAQWLNGENQELGGLIGITIEHQEPQLLKILRALQHTPLSPIQKEVASLLAQGMSNEKIGESLQIKLTTVKDHVRKIFVKLDIDHREDLLLKLMKLDQGVFVHLV